MEQNLNLYQIFYEVACCRSFSVAAKKLYISQPAVSKSISHLEADLHTILFHRSSRGVSLTAEGEMLYQHVEKALFVLQSGEELLKSVSSSGTSQLSIGVSTTLCKYVLLPLLKNFMTENPNIKITITCQSSFETLSSLQKGSIDIGLVGISSVAEMNRLPLITCLPLKTIQDIFVATDSYLAPFLHRVKGDLYKNEDFFKEASFIMLDKENISRKHADTFLSDHQLKPYNVIEVNNMDLSIEFARAGLGIACVIEDFVRSDLKNGILRELKLGHKIPKRQIGFAYPAKMPVSHGMNTLMQYCRTMI